MVMFICDVCGECLRKNAVSKHANMCRGCYLVSCMDCNDHFNIETFVSHTKCVSEEQKYSGKNYVPRENKGEVKQDAWFSQVQEAIASVNPRNNALRVFLQRLMDYPNIPRKEAKFKNFVTNSLNVRDRNLVEEAWSMISAAAKKPAVNAQTSSNEGNKEMSDLSQHETPKSLDKDRKRKHEPFEERELENNAEASNETELGCEKMENDVSVDDEPSIKKFKWTSVAKRILKDAADQELKFRKLEKRVVSEYLASVPAHFALSPEDASTRLRNKLTRSEKFSFENGRVRYLG